MTGQLKIDQIFLFALLTMRPFGFSHADPSASYIRQLENRVRMLEDDNKQLLSQVTITVLYHIL